MLSIQSPSARNLYNFVYRKRGILYSVSNTKCICIYDLNFCKIYCKTKYMYKHVCIKKKEKRGSMINKIEIHYLRRTNGSRIICILL